MLERHEYKFHHYGKWISKLKHVSQWIYVGLDCVVVKRWG